MMKQLKNWVYMVTAITIIALLAACGGSSSSKRDGAAGTELVLADPYIVGAEVNEFDSEGEPFQTQIVTDNRGWAKFANQAKVGHTIEMRGYPGTHGLGGPAFKGNLKRYVDTNQGTEPYTVTPLTTLIYGLSDGTKASYDAAETEVLTFLKDELGLIDEDYPGGVQAILYLNPMKPVEDADEVSTTSLKIMVVNMAVNTALNAANAAGITISIENVTTVAKLSRDTISNGLGAAISAATDSGSPNVTDIVTRSIVSRNDQLTTSLLAKIEEAEELGTTIDFDMIVEGIEEALDGYDKIVEDVIENPITTKVADALTEGFEAIIAFTSEESAYMANDLNAAVNKFKTAKSLIATDTTATQNEKDVAYFFGAFAEFMTIFNPYSDFIDGNGINNLGGLLDAFGIPTAGRGELTALPIEGCDNMLDAETGDILFEMCNPSTDQLKEGAPTTGELQSEIGPALLATLSSVVADLNKVSTSFKKEQALFGEEATVFDYSDALFVKGVAQAMNAQVGLIMAYDINVDLYELQQNPILLDGTSANDMVVSYQEFLEDYPEFGTLADGYAARLTAAETAAKAAVDTLIAAVNAVAAETGDQTNHLVIVDADEVAELSTDLNYVKQSLNGPAPFGDTTVDFSKLFDGINLRDKLDVSLNVGTGKLLFPDTTMGGVIVDGLDVNEDLDNNNIPDVLDDIAEMFGFQTVQ